MYCITIAIVAGRISTKNLSPFMIVLVVLLPLFIGAITGIITGLILRKQTKKKINIVILIIAILITSGIGFLFNYVILLSPVLNFMLIGMAFSAMFSNMIMEEQLEYIMNGFNPILGIAILIVILNLGIPLDYHLMLSAGLFTFIYIVSRALGKYLCAYFGASVTHSPKTVKKYLGLTLLPHSGVSLVFTGIAVSILIGPDKDGANLIQGTIAAAAVINEIIAVIFAKKGFEWAGELQKQDFTENNGEDDLNWVNYLLSCHILDAKIIRVRNKDLGDLEDFNETVTITMDEVKEILLNFENSKLYKTWHQGKGGIDKDHLIISYENNDQNYEFEIYYGTIVVDKLDDEFKKILENNKYDEKNTEYKNTKGSFYFYSIDNYSETIFDKYFE